jgi:hypothetical protein
MGQEWRTTTPSPVSFDAGSSLVVSPRHVIEPEQLIAWDPTAVRWLRIRPPDGGPRTGVSAAWLQGGLLLWGGVTSKGVAQGDGWTFSPWLGRRTVALPEQGIGLEDGCSESVFTPHGERLTGAIDDPRVTWFAGTRDRGARIKWLPGYTARFRPKLEVVDPSGVVVAREGDRLRATRYHVLLNDLHVCPIRYFDVRGSSRMLRWIGNDGGGTGQGRETAGSEAASPFEALWRPLRAGGIPFRYRCNAEDSFTATDLADASPAAQAPDPLAEAIAQWGGRMLDEGSDWYRVSQVDDRVLALAPTSDDRFPVEELELKRTTTEGPGYETWDFAGGGDCRPEAVLGGGIAGQWRLDLRFPAPGRKTRTLHVLGYNGCNGTEKTGPARVHVTDDAMLIAIPMASILPGDACAGLGPVRMTVKLPEPLGRRTLYDAGSLPLRGGTEKLDR